MSDFLEYIDDCQKRAIDLAVRGYERDFGSHLRGYLLTMSKNEKDAEDLYQTTMMKMTEELKGYVHPSLIRKPKGLAFRIGRNLAFDECRRKKRRGGTHLPLEEAELEKIPGSDKDGPSHVCERHELLALILEDLNRDDFILLKEKFIDGLSLGQIADREGIPESNENREQIIWNRINRLIERLRKKAGRMLKMEQIRLLLKRIMKGRKDV